MPDGLRIRPESPLHPAGFTIRRVWQSQYSLKSKRTTFLLSTGFPLHATQPYAKISNQLRLHRVRTSTN